MATMVSGLGGPAGYGEGVFSSTGKVAGNNDDGSVFVDVSSVFGDGIDFFGSTYTGLYINSNGNISFGSANTAYAPNLTGTSTPTIAAFWGDVDINKGGNIYWDLDPASGKVTITWLNVRAYSGSTTTNSFQIVLTSLGDGNANIEYIYGDINWTNGGSGVAQTGLTNGGATDILLPGSGNSATLAGYETYDFGTDDPNGTTDFYMINGSASTTDGIVEGTAGNDLLDYTWALDPDGDSIGAGSDTIYGYGGDDTIIGGAGADNIFAGDGDDTIIWNLGDGNDVIDGGAGGETDGDTLDITVTGTATSTTFTGDGTGTTTAGGTVIDFSDIENFVFDAGTADTFDARADTTGISVDTGGGDDWIAGGSGSDTIDGGAGNDTIYGDTAGAVTPTGPNLIVNGSFEDVTGMLDDPVYGYYYSQGSIPGWTEVNGNQIDVHYNSRNGVAPSDGTNWLDMAEANGSTTVSQAVSGVTTGTDYQLTFDVADLADGYDGTAGDNMVTVYWGGELLTTIDPIDNGIMVSYTFVVTGGAGDGSNTLVFEGTGASPYNGASVDNVQMYELTATGSGSGDVIDGGAGDDVIYGEFGDDVITGGAGADEIYGGGGADTLYVGADDTASGGDGDDMFILDPLNAYGGPGSTITIIGDEDGETGGDTLDFAGLIDWGTISYTDAESGTATLSDGTTVAFSNIENIIICFTEGTMIATPFGERPIESLRAGDFVLTRDHGAQPLRWIGSSTVQGTGLLAPIEFATGAFGNDRPLLVSPQHRMLYEGGLATLYFDAREVMVPAKHLVNGTTIREVARERLRYIHLLFDHHEVVYANGAASESFHPGAEGMEALDTPTREELFTVFPELRANPGQYGQTARTVLKSYEARLLT